MALQVWLPLNGDIENQGVSDISVTNVGATVSSAGKIGQCYYFNGSSQYLQFNKSLPNLYCGDFSWALWVKPTDDSRGILISEYSSAGSSNVALELLANRQIRVYWDASPDWSTGVYIDSNVWSHVTVTKSENLLKVYVNGELKVTGNYTLSDKTSSSKIRIGDDYRGGTAVSYQGYLNDVRIYNHCLSSKEVKEISKGLMLHYKMDDGHVEPTTNLAPYPTPGSTVNPGWDTSKHPNAISVSGWSSGYNSGVGSPEKGYHACWNVIDGIPTIVYRNLNSEIGAANRWLGISSNSVTISSGTKYTISYEAKSTSGSGQIGSGIYYNNGSSTNFHDGCPYVTVGREWKRYSCTFTAKSAVSGAIYIYGYSGTEGINYVRNIQLELKDHATPYTPTSRSETIVYDCSGFGYNGTVTSTTAPILDYDSPRYNSCFNFDTTGKYITCPAIDFSGMTASYSFAWWGKTPSWDVGLMYWGFSNGNRLNYYSGYYWNTGDGSNNPFYSSGTTTITRPSVNVWHHYVVTGNGSATKLYVDGTLYGTAKTNRNITGTQIYIHGWDSSVSYKNAGDRISDFRIYATPLSAEDVKELYNTSAIVCDNGTVMAYSLEE